MTLEATHSLGWLSCRMKMTDKGISELEGRWIEILPYEKQKNKVGKNPLFHRNNIGETEFHRIISRGWKFVLLESLLEVEYKDIGVEKVLEEGLKMSQVQRKKFINYRLCQ